jgi:hypothetical protein
MSPKKTNTYASFPESQTFSPWTDAYQTNPMHLNGNYSNGNSNQKQSSPQQDETQSPTHEALLHIYDFEERGY